MRGGPSLKGKGGLVGFRKDSYGSREDWWVFEDPLRFKEALVVFQRFKKVLVGFQNTSLNAKEVFRKPFLSPIS